MSYRVLQSFCEHCRIIGFHKQLSLETFNSPNFGLIAELLVWALKKYRPCEFDVCIATEKERQQFLISVVQRVLADMQIKLNVQKLYAGDKHSVNELWKLTSVLFSIICNKSIIIAVDAFDENESLHENVFRQEGVLQSASDSASSVIHSGANVHSLLDKGIHFQNNLSVILRRETKVDALGLIVRNAIQSIRQSVETYTNSKVAVDNENRSVMQKVHRKKTTMERLQNRLITLSKIRPTFMNDFEKLELKLAELYQEYVTKYQCLLSFDADMGEASRTPRKNPADTGKLVSFQHSNRSLPASQALPQTSKERKYGTDNKDSAVQHDHSFLKERLGNADEDQVSGAGIHNDIQEKSLEEMEKDLDLETDDEF